MVLDIEIMPTDLNTDNPIVIAITRALNRLAITHNFKVISVHKDTHVNIKNHYIFSLIISCVVYHNDLKVKCKLTAIASKKLYTWHRRHKYNLEVKTPMKFRLHFNEQYINE